MKSAESDFLKRAKEFFKVHNTIKIEDGDRAWKDYNDKERNMMISAKRWAKLALREQEGGAK